MKRWMMCLILGFFVAFLGGNVCAATYNPSTADLILLVDVYSGSADDGNVKFKFKVRDWEFGTEDKWTLGELNSDGEFQSFNTAGSGDWFVVKKEGGDYVDFAIKKGNKVLSLSGWGMPENYSVTREFGAAVSKSDLDLDSVVVTPSDIDTWYEDLALIWKHGDEVIDFEFLMMKNKKDLYSGFASEASPSAVPIPTTAFLLGTGVLGLVGIRRKFMK
jgi:hypothetical protein